jgi:hypothetical protein
MDVAGCTFPLQALSKLGMDNAEIQKIITEVDKDGNGEIDYNEFCVMVSCMPGCSDGSTSSSCRPFKPL